MDHDLSTFRAVFTNRKIPETFSPPIILSLSSRGASRCPPFRPRVCVDSNFLQLRFNILEKLAPRNVDWLEFRGYTLLFSPPPPPPLSLPFPLPLSGSLSTVVRARVIQTESWKKEPPRVDRNARVCCDGGEWGVVGFDRTRDRYFRGDVCEDDHIETHTHTNRK